MKLNFHRVYLDTNWDMCKVSLVGIGIMLMIDINLHGMVENLQCSLTKHRNDIIEITGIDLYWIINHLSDGNSGAEKEQV